MTIEERLGDYDEIRKNALALYNSFGKIKCPALGNEYVYFTSEGFNHLIYKSPRKPRDKRVQILRFDMLEKAKFITQTSTTYQEYEENLEHIRVNRHGKWVYESVLIKSWGLIAVIKGLRVKVILRQAGNGKREFHSVIPAWFIKQYKDIKIYHNSTGKGLAHEDDDQILENAARGGVS